MTTTITADNVFSLVASGELTVDEAANWQKAENARNKAEARSDATNVKHTDKGGLWMRHPDMLCPVKPESYAKKVASGKAAKPTYNAAVNMADGQWQAFFACTDRAGLVTACREHGADVLASVLEFIDGLGDVANVDKARIVDASLARIAAHDKAVKASKVDDETDAEYAARTGK